MLNLLFPLWAKLVGRLRKLGDEGRRNACGAVSQNRSRGQPPVDFFRAEADDRDLVILLLAAKAIATNFRQDAQTSMLLNDARALYAVERNVQD
jgi:hypothetical protein